MAVFTISATVNEQDISLDFNGSKLVSGSKDIYQIQFTFSEDWDSYTKKVVFENPTPKRAVIEILLTGTNICTIPIRSLANPTFLRVGVYGVGTNDEVMPTVWSDKFPIHEGTYQGYENPAAPDPDVYDEILAAMAGKTDVATTNQLDFALEAPERALDLVFEKWQVWRYNDQTTLLQAGGINAATGSKNGSSYNSKRCYSTYYTLESDMALVEFGLSEYQWCVCCYSGISLSSSTFTHSETKSTYIVADAPIVAKAGNDGTKYLRCAFQRVDGANMTTDLTDPTSDYSKIKAALNVKYFAPRSRARVTNNISLTPRYQIPRYIRVDKTLYTGSAEDASGVNHQLTQGCCSDGQRYVYYAFCTAGVKDASDFYVNVDKPVMVKYDTWTNQRVALSLDPAVNYGHTEDMCFVPADIAGFDNGTVDRIYIIDGNHSPVYDEQGNIVYDGGYPTHTTGRYVHVVSADDLSYITSFQTADLISTSVAQYWTGFNHIVCCPTLGLFCVESPYVIENDDNYHTLAIFNESGTLVKAVQFIMNVGTLSGFDCDENYVYYARYAASNDRLFAFDWDMNPIAVCNLNHYQWEWEGICHIGQDIFTTWNQTASGRTGAELAKGYVIRNVIFAPSATFPADSWISSAISPSGIVQVYPT